MIPPKKLKPFSEEILAVRRCIGSVEIDIAPRDDTADWLAQVLQVLVSNESSFRTERDRALEQLHKLQEVSAALLKALKKYKCPVVYCKDPGHTEDRAAIALAERSEEKA